jgi:hypothetical protein
VPQATFRKEGSRLSTSFEHGIDDKVVLAPAYRLSDCPGIERVVRIGGAGYSSPLRV